MNSTPRSHKLDVHLVSVTLLQVVAAEGARRRDQAFVCQRAPLSCHHVSFVTSLLRERDVLDSIRHRRIPVPALDVVTHREQEIGAEHPAMRRIGVHDILELLVT